LGRGRVAGPVVPAKSGWRCPRYAGFVATLRLFASAREAAGTARATVAGATVAEVLDAAVAAYGDHFRAVLGTCKVWVNGDDADGSTPVGDDDEVAVLPPVSGG
jgi:molybdopterin synthase sulfur carrier subunit